MEKIHRPLIWLFCKLQLWPRLFYMISMTETSWTKWCPTYFPYLLSYLFMMNISENRPCRIHHDVITSTCMPVSITTWHDWFWWWWVYTIDITMIASYPSTLFKRTTKFTLLSLSLFSYLFQASLSLLKILSKIKLIMFNCHQSIPC